MKFNTYILLFVLAAVTLCGCGDDTFEQEYTFTRNASTRLGQQLIDGSGSYIGHVKSDSETRPTKGVSLLRMSYLNEKGAAMQLFLYQVNLGEVTLRVTLPDDQPTLGPLQPLSEQVAALERKSVYTVWGAISGDTFAANGQPTGIVYHDGVALKETMDKGATALFAILEDGQAACLPASGYESIRPKIREAVGGTVRLIGNGYLLPQEDTAPAARTAIGVSEDGGTVYLLTVDGSDFYYSNGISYDQMAQLLKACGATNAMTLSSGVNVTAIWRNERLSSLFGVLNRPTNNSLEAGIANGLAIVER